MPAPAPEPALAFSLLGYPLRLAEPGALWLLAVVAGLALLGALAVVRRRAARRRAAGPLAARVAPSAGRARPAARLGLSALALALLSVALARPQCGTRAEVTQRHGLDLVVVLDASRSMLATDVRPDRLSRAKLELGALLGSPPQAPRSTERAGGTSIAGGDRVGLVVFAGDAFVRCPLTSDHAAVSLFLRGISPDALPRQGTALARALVSARELLDASGAGGRAKVVLVVSDGEDHEGGTASAVRALAAAGARVFALAVGTAEGAPVPSGSARGGGGGLARRERDGREGGGRGAPAEPARTRLDLTTLRLLAELGDGEVYDVRSPEGGIAAFRAALDRMERTELEGRVTVRYEDRYALAAFPAFLLLLGALLLREGRSATGEDDR
jgi:Ca-activated chloride channel family protein